MSDSQRLAVLAMQHWYVLPVLTLMATVVVVEWLRDF